MRWALLLLALACGLGLLVLPAGAVPSASSPVSIVVDESVASGDGPTATPPAGVGSDEPVGTSDAVSVSPPASVPGVESVSVSDAVTVEPPVTIVVDESVSPADAPCRRAAGVRGSQRDGDRVGLRVGATRRRGLPARRADPTVAVARPAAGDGTSTAAR